MTPTGSLVARLAELDTVPGDVIELAALVERRLDTAEAALVEVLAFHTSELDPDPAPWPEYVTGSDRAALVAELAARHEDEQDDRLARRRAAG